MGGGSKCDSYFAKGWSSYGAVQTSAARGSELSKPSSDTMMMFPITGVEDSSAPCTPDFLQLSLQLFVAILQLFAPRVGRWEIF